MADIMPFEKDEGSDYITYSCHHCEEKFGSEDTLKQNMKTCHCAQTTPMVKTEAEEGNGGPQPIPCSCPGLSEVTWSCYGIKAEPCPSPPGCADLSLTVSPLLATQGVVPGQASVLRPPPVLGQPCPLQVPGGQLGMVSQPVCVPGSQPAVVSQSLQASQVRLPVHMQPEAPSPKYHDATKKLTASEILRQRARKKKTVTPSTPTVRNILPKGSETDANKKLKEESSSSDSGPKIERVYYTAKGEYDQFGLIKVAENALHPPPLTKEFELVHANLNHAKSGPVAQGVLNPAVQFSAPSGVRTTVVQAQTMAGPKVIASTAGHQALLLQTAPRFQPGPQAATVTGPGGQVVQPVQGLHLQYGSGVVTVSGAQTVQPPPGLPYGPARVQMPAVFPSALNVPQVPQGLSVPQVPQSLSVSQVPQSLSVPQLPQSLSVPQVPQSLLSCPQTVLAKQQTVVQNNPNVVLPQNMLLVQPAPGGMVQNSVVVRNGSGSLLLPMVSPQQVPVAGAGTGVKVAPPLSSVLAHGTGVKIFPMSSGSGVSLLLPAGSALSPVLKAISSTATSNTPSQQLSLLAGNKSTTTIATLKTSAQPPHISVAGNEAYTFTVTSTTSSQQHSSAAGSLSTTSTVTPKTSTLQNSLLTRHKSIAPKVTSKAPTQQGSLLAGDKSTPPTVTPKISTQQPISVAGSKSTTSTVTPKISTQQPISVAGDKSTPPTVTPKISTQQPISVAGDKSTPPTVTPKISTQQPISVAGDKSTTSTVTPKISTQQPISVAGNKSSSTVTVMSSMQWPISVAGNKSTTSTVTTKTSSQQSSSTAEKKPTTPAVTAKTSTQQHSSLAAEKYLVLSSSVENVVQQGAADNIPHSVPLVTSPQVMGGLNAVVSSQACSQLTAAGGAGMVLVAGGVGGSTVSPFAPAMSTAALLADSRCPHAGPVPLPISSSPSLTGTALSPSLPGMVAPLAPPTSAGLLSLPLPAPCLNSLQSQQSPLAPCLNSLQSQQSPLAAGAVGSYVAGVTPAIPGKQASSIVLLPPVIAQGYMLNGIRMDGPRMPQSTDVSNSVCVFVPGKLAPGQPSSVVEPAAATPAAQNSSVGGSSGSPVSCSGSVQAGSSSDPKRQSPEPKDGMSKAQVLPLSEAKEDAETVPTAEPASKDKPSTLSLMFLVEGSSSQCTAAQVRVILEDKVAQVARGLLSRNREEHSPVPLDDGRAFFPVTYIGPYIPKNTKKFVTEKDSGQLWIVENGDKKAWTSGYRSSEGTKSTLQSVQLFGKVVWIFLDLDGPQILWKLEGKDNLVLSLPLEGRLPLEALSEIRRMVFRYRLILPPGVDPFDSEHNPKKPKKAKTDIQPCVLKEKTNASSFQPFQQGPITSQGLWMQRKRKLSNMESLNTGSGSAASPSLLQAASGCRTSEDCTATAEGQQSQHSSAQQGPPGEGRRWASPRLTVREKAHVIQRALQAVVRLERLPLTERMRQQLKAGRQRKDVLRLPTVNSERANMCEENPMQKVKVEELAIKKEDRDFGHAEQMEHDGDAQKMETAGSDHAASSSAAAVHSGQDLVKQEVYIKTEDLRDVCSVTVKQEMLAESEDWRYAQEWTEVKWTDSGQQHTEAKRRKREKSAAQSKGAQKGSAETPGFVGGTFSDSRVRRSCRALGQPRPDYALLEQGYYNKDEASQHVFGETGGKLRSLEKSPKIMGSKTIKEQKLTAEKKAHTVQSRLMSKAVSEFDIYIDRSEDMEEEDEESVPVALDSGSNWEGEGQDQSEAQKFLQQHGEDFRAIVLKEGQQHPTSESDSGQLFYICEICKYMQSRSIETLIAHLKEHYSGELHCKTCLFRAASKQELTEHEALEHTGKPLYHCPVCHIPFFSQVVFLSHQRRHENTLCKICRLYFHNQCVLEIHQEMCHFNSEQFICHLCCKKMSSEEEVRSHYQHCMEGYQCCLCYVKKATISKLRGHMACKHNRHKMPNVCMVGHCGASFLNKKALNEHTARHFP